MVLFFCYLLYSLGKSRESLLEIDLSYQISLVIQGIAHAGEWCSRLGQNYESFDLVDIATQLSEAAIERNQACDQG